MKTRWLRGDCSLDATLRGMAENETDEYIEKTEMYPERIKRIESLLLEVPTANIRETRDLLLGYHIGIMLEITMRKMPLHTGEDMNKFWTMEDIWKIIESKVFRLNERIEQRLNR